jgi:hypothetical protein
VLAHEALAVPGAQVDLVDPLDDRGGSLEVVALDEQHAVTPGHERVADDVGGLVGLVGPPAPGVAPATGVELVDPSTPLVGVVGEGTLEHRVEVAPASAHGLEPAARVDPGSLSLLEVGALR